MASKDGYALNHIILSLVAVLALFVAFSYAATDGGGALGASYIFGDSLVDAGNNNFLATLSKANIKPNGIDFKPSGGLPTGRYTNGRTIGDILGMINIVFGYERKILTHICLFCHYLCTN